MQDNFEEGQLPLYGHARLTLSEAMVLILLFCTKHKLSQACMEDLIKLIGMFIPQPNILVRSLYLFKKYFVHMKYPLVFHYYCNSCFGELNSKEDQCPRCEGNPGVSYFLTISIIQQLQRMFLREGFFESLSYRFRRRKAEANNLEDIYDGQIFKDFITDVIDRLNIQNFLAFLWNTDGVSVFKSSKFSVWPFFLVNILLPPEHRFRRENVVLAGLWFGKSQPQPNVFMNAIVPEVEQLRRGVPFRLPNVNQPVPFNGFIICGTCDTPAKSKFLNLVSHCGFQSCPKCKVFGVKSELSDQIFVYPNAQARDPRTDQETWDNGGQALLVRHPQNGVLGPSALFQLVLNALSSLSIDFMHCQYMGCVKKLIKLWTSSKYSEEPFSLREHVKVLERLIMSIKPPHFVQRLPSSIDECLAFWKASEFRSFLFHYSLPVLHGIMDQNYFQHYSMLVMGLYLLNKDSISEGDLNLASQLLTKFVIDFEGLYGLKFMSINFHLIHHLVDIVRKLGPAWATTCFGLEDLNGILTRAVHGTRYVDLQMCSAFSMFASIPSLIRDINDEAVRAFCHYLQSKRARVKTTERLHDNIYRVGNIRHVPAGDVPFIVSRALQAAGLLNVNVFIFSRLKAGKFLYTAESYSLNFKTCSCVCQYFLNGTCQFGVIKSFVRVSRCPCVRACQCPCNYYAIIQNIVPHAPFGNQAGQVDVSFIRLCLPTENYHAVDVRNLKIVCWRIDVNARMYVCTVVNSIELE